MDPFLQTIILPSSQLCSEWMTEPLALLLLIQNFGNFPNGKKIKFIKKKMFTDYLAEGLRPYSGCDITHLFDCYLFQHTVELSKISFASIPNPVGTDLS